MTSNLLAIPSLTLMLRERTKYENEFFDTLKQYTYAKIQTCIINQRGKVGKVISSECKSATGILVLIIKDMMQYMTRDEILEKSKMNFKMTKEAGIHGYHWQPKINMSMQNRNFLETLKEIVRLAKSNRMWIDMSIKLTNGHIIHFKL